MVTKESGVLRVRLDEACTLLVSYSFDLWDSTSSGIDRYRLGKLSLSRLSLQALMIVILFEGSKIIIPASGMGDSNHFDRHTFGVLIIPLARC